MCLALVRGLPASSVIARYVPVDTQMLLLTELICKLADVPQLCGRLLYRHLVDFFSLVQRLAPFITLSTPRRTIGLPVLPAQLRDTLSNALGLHHEDVHQLWTTLGDVALNASENTTQLPSSGQTIDTLLGSLSTQHHVGKCHFSSSRHALPQHDRCQVSRLWSVR